MKQVSLDEALWAIGLLPHYLPNPEPIGPFSRREKMDLETAIRQPFASFDGRYQYWYMYHRAAAMFYYVIKDHSLGNGNKRSAVIVTMFFLFKNGKTFNLSSDELYNLACSVAETPSHEKDNQITRLKHSFKEHIVNLPQGI